jgi:hypothetical protein
MPTHVFNEMQRLRRSQEAPGQQRVDSWHGFCTAPHTRSTEIPDIFIIVSHRNFEV